MNDSLLRWRKEFPIVNTSTYLISNSLGAMPDTVYKRMYSYAETWATRGVRAWADSWWEMPVSAGNVIAPLIGAKSGEVSMHTNISLLQAILISCFDFSGKRKKIVYSDMEFPSVMYVYEQFAVSQGAKLKIVQSRDGISVPVEKILNAIDEKTLLVPISHVLFKSAFIQDVKAIAEKAHRCGAIVILDAYHSVGTIPVNVHSLGVDILVGGVLKWLCGGPGGAFLWVRPGLRRKLQPQITGWCAHQEPFAFSKSMRYTNDAFRFLNGTPSIPALYASSEGPRIIAKAGIAGIRKKSKHQTSFLIERAKEYGFSVLTPLDAEQRGGTVSIDVPHGYEVSRELLRRNIIIDFRKGSGIRIAPHFYNSDDEVIYVVDQIKEILASKAYRRHTRTKSTVT